MDCADCARTIEKGVRQLPGVQSVEVNFATGKLRLAGDVPLEMLSQRVRLLGYQLAEPAPRPAPRPHGLLGFWRYLLARTETRLALLGSLGIVLAWAGEQLGLSPMAANGSAHHVHAPRRLPHRPQRADDALHQP